ncbi:hypothetical protein AC623_19490 [Bacillus sp. FJAT-27231]|uniref:hypothetical protein n=1 Tax=Bacillus sp. FJAT-27231 TaxID=1679168 RepID=UPI0006712678|nr:hypothetical protein [Bacillus sp. FJAT-27231]KMY55851.1 hypothetical protein AC623_19490 [Bacillus sp. FJAT-27231]
MTSILTQKPVFAEKEILRGLQQYDRQANVHMNGMVFYPYYFFEYDISAKSLLKLQGKIACTIDALSGQGAMVDVQPEFSTYLMEGEEVLPITIAENEAEPLAERFISQTLSQKAKFITIPRLHLSSCSLFYRPFWLAKYTKPGRGQQPLIVDAISGSYHPL